QRSSELYALSLHDALPISGNYNALSRLGGGIGTRGPGETKIEQDRRVLRNEIQRIKGELKEVEKHRSRTRENREKGAIFQLGLIGYTNAGKSTIDRKSTRLNSSHVSISYAVFCLKK